VTSLNLLIATVVYSKYWPGYTS